MTGRAFLPSTSQPVWLLSADEMQRWDRRALEEQGVPERVLMESAGRAAARVLHRLYPSGRVVAAVGRGNNGGDALVLLRCLRAWGRDVVAVPVGGASVVPDLLHGWDLPVAEEGELERALAGAFVAVDGILGTGARGAPREPQAAAARALNAAGVPVVALDGPTGVDLTTGAAPGDAVRAEVTITFGMPKRGLLLFPGRAHAGRVVAVEVGFPPLREDDASAAVVTEAWARAHAPALPPNAHKGQVGTVVVVAGRRGMAGAAILVATGALRAGAGGVRVVTPEENRVPVQAAVPEAVQVDRDAAEVDEAVEAADALVVGPGMGTDENSRALLRAVLQRSSAPVLLDADALTLLARQPDLLPADAAERVVLTPHPGEMARLLEVGTAEVVADPFAAVHRALERFGCAVLLKGFPSLVAGPSGPVLVNVAGHAGIATGGMGDTLAGVAGAFLGMGASPRDAAALALFFAGRAAELAGRGRALLPRDVAEALPAALVPAEAPELPEFPDVVFDLPAPG